MKWPSLAAPVTVVTVAAAATLGAAAFAPPQAASPTQAGRDYPIVAVPLTSVRLTGGFWRDRLETNRTVTIPHIMRQNEATNRVANFLKAAGKMPGAYEGQRYNDTDVYKIIEAASYSLAAHPDPALDAEVDALIATIAAAQAEDGYLYTPRLVDPANPPPGVGPERWSYLHTSHELYDQGHMIEAAVAHYQATGKRTFLDIAIRSADLIVRTFGPDRRRDVPGHEEIELALVKLSRVTGNRAYLDTAKFFLDERGREHSVEHVQFPQGDRFFMYNQLDYRQDHQPVVDQTRATGHAVRATYLYSGMTDAAVLTGDTAFGRTVDALFDDVVGKRMYITGGLGSVGSTEAFGPDYALPNRTAYTETCASIGGLLWYHRLFLKEADGKYLDAFERTLYNGYLSGVSIAGNTFFYQNPLESTGRGRGRATQRQPYFDVACCPANLARLMAQLPGLIYS
ncbi:MAG: glycoside hydrolase family 127 protein, partial [Vicinamibacterales bacterium]